MSIAAIDKALTAAARESLVPGFVAAARLSDGQRFEAAYGARSVAGPTAMTPDTVFWIASFTKLVTTIAALQLVEAGALDLNQTVASILPDFAELPILDGYDDAGKPRLRKATDAPAIRHLLTHTSGLGYTFMDADLARYAEQEGIGPDQAHRLPRQFDAGQRWHYGVGIDWAGAVIEAVTGKGLDTVVAAAITGPLGMTDTGFALTEAQKTRAAAMHARLPDGSLVPIDFALPPPPNFSLGGGGLHSTAADYLSLLTAILDGEILNEASRAALFANQVGDLQAGVLVSSNPALTNDFEPMPGDPKRWSLGLLLNQRPGPDGRPVGAGAWAGLANCYYWIDPITHVAGVILTQVLPFADEKALRLFSSFERAVYA